MRDGERDIREKRGEEREREREREKKGRRVREKGFINYFNLSVIPNL